jgi:quinol monooxygenase YgiN
MADVNVGLWVPLVAKPGREDAVAEFLRTAKPLVEAEPGTIAWFAVRLDASTFGIFDVFEDEAGRNAHLSGRVAEALMQQAEDLFAEPPNIARLDVLASKLAG